MGVAWVMGGAVGNGGAGCCGWRGSARVMGGAVWVRGVAAGSGAMAGLGPCFRKVAYSQRLLHCIGVHKFMLSLVEFMTCM